MIIIKEAKEKFYLSEDNGFIYILLDLSKKHTGDDQELYVSKEKMNDKQYKKFVKDNQLSFQTYPATNYFDETKLKKILNKIKFIKNDN